MITTYINFIKNVRNLSDRTCANYEFVLRAFARWMSENVNDPSWSSLQVADLEKYITFLRNSEHSTVSINYYVTVIKVFMDYLVRFHGLKSNPALLIGRLKQPIRLPKYIEDATIRKVINHFSSSCFRHRRSRVAIALAYFAGLRVSELASLSWPNVNLRENYIRVIGKGNKERLIPICSDLRLELLNWRAYSIMLFSNSVPDNVLCKRTGQKASVRLIEEFIYFALKKFCEPEVCHPHALRHSFATNLMRKGVSIQVIQKLMGHSNINTTMVYLSVTSDYLLKEFNKAFTL